MNDFLSIYDLKSLKMWLFLLIQSWKNSRGDLELRFIGKFERNMNKTYSVNDISPKIYIKHWNSEHLLSCFSNICIKYDVVKPNESLIKSNDVLKKGKIID